MSQLRELVAKHRLGHLPEGVLDFSCDGVCCDERLSQAQTTVARGNLGMSKNLKVKELQFANQVFEHEHVVECAAAQADPIQRGFLAQQAREARESFDQPVVESPTDCCRAHFPAEILDDGAE
jgi:hypothetical protein